MSNPDDEKYTPGSRFPVQKYAGWLRLFIIPLLVYSAWFVETFLLVGQARLFQNPGATGLFLYTLVACILIGFIVPVMYLRRSFLSGAVNMHQVGFRPAWRTGPIVLVTVLVLLPISILFNPFGTDRMAFLQAFLLVLPTAAASVMICFVLLGTHIQAFMREGGIIASVSSGVIVTSFLFGFTSLVRAPGLSHENTFLLTLGTGVIIAVFFFSLRDIYSTILLTAVCLVFTLAGQLSPPALESVSGAISAAACLTVVFLLGVHVYFFRKYATILVKAS
ncbi:hypothetical protein [uncultured Methanoregula sp.]|uniref:hypothetical protein n=1 Tax=uncultured Methanoregula sp. TaxID=1005933 RepID=UPI002AAAA3E6|nr:hypothetical protein [uncultured Methanoregula sp.]